MVPGSAGISITGGEGDFVVWLWYLVHHFIPVGSAPVSLRRFGSLVLPVVNKSAIVPYNTQQMFELVRDVPSYPKFLPWCSAAKLISSSETELCGEIEVSRVGVRQKFSTCNRLYPFERIDLTLREGPFRKLHGDWRFTPLGDTACKVELALEFEFSGN